MRKKTFGEELRAFREGAELTLQQVQDLSIERYQSSEKLWIITAQLSRVECGISSFSILKLLVLADLYSVQAEDLLDAAGFDGVAVVSDVRRLVVEGRG